MPVPFTKRSRCRHQQPASGCCNRTEAAASADGYRYAREQSDRPGTAPSALNPRSSRRVGRCRDRLDPGSDLEARARNVAIALARAANAKLS